MAVASEAARPQTSTEIEALRPSHRRIDEPEHAHVGDRCCFDRSRSRPGQSGSVVRPDAEEVHLGWMSRARRAASGVSIIAPRSGDGRPSSKPVSAGRTARTCSGSLTIGIRFEVASGCRLRRLPTAELACVWCLQQQLDSALRCTPENGGVLSPPKSSSDVAVIPQARREIGLRNLIC